MRIIALFNIFFGIYMIACNSEIFDLDKYCQDETHANEKFLICDNLNLTNQSKDIELNYTYPYYNYGSDYYYDNYYDRRIYNRYVIKVFRCQDNCIIPIVSRKMFNKLTELEEINLNNCEIRDIDKYVFENSTSLREIFLSNNFIHELKSFTFSDMKISGIYLSIDLRNNTIEKIEDYCFKNKYIQEINLQLNHLDTIKLKMFADANSLQLLDLSHNIIEHIEEYSFQEQTKLTKMLLSDNKLKTIGKNTFSGLKSLKELDLSNNLIKLINDIAFQDLNYLTVLNLEHNNLKIITVNTFKYLTSLTDIRLNDNSIENIEDNAFQNLNKIHEFPLHNNQLKIIHRNTLSGLSSLRLLDLSANSIELIEDSAFSEMKSISFIDLHNNKIKSFDDVKIGYISNHSKKLDFSMNSIESVYFGNNHKLDILNLSSNQIEKLDFDTFEGLDLDTLILSNNKIEKFDTHVLYPMSNLHTLYIDFNRISEIDYEDPRFNISRIKISYNNWNCTYLKKIIRYFHTSNVQYIVDEKPNTTLNVAGIGCVNEHASQQENEITNLKVKAKNVSEYNIELLDNVEDNFQKSVIFIIDEKIVQLNKSNENFKQLMKTTIDQNLTELNKFKDSFEKTVETLIVNLDELKKLYEDFENRLKKVEHLEYPTKISSTISSDLTLIVIIFCALTVSLNIWIFLFYKNKIKTCYHTKFTENHELLDIKDNN